MCLILAVARTLQDRAVCGLSQMSVEAYFLRTRLCGPKKNKKRPSATDGLRAQSGIWQSRWTVKPRQRTIEIAAELEQMAAELDAS